MSKKHKTARFQRPPKPKEQVIIPPVSPESIIELLRADFWNDVKRALDSDQPVAPKDKPVISEFSDTEIREALEFIREGVRKTTEQTLGDYAARSCGTKIMNSLLGVETTEAKLRQTCELMGLPERPELSTTEILMRRDEFLQALDLVQAQDPTPLWVVNLLGDTHFELSICQRDNEHGKSSFGWYGDRKKVIAEGNRNNYTTEGWQDLLELAQREANRMIQRT